MKRWKNLLGRGGTVLISISLALLLVSLIPRTELGSSMGTMPVSPDAVFTPYSRTLTPQQGLRVKVTVEGVLNVYLLELGNGEPPGTNMRFANSTELLDFLETNQSLIIWSSPKLENESFERSYSPTKVTNATIVLYNPSSDQTQLDWEITLTSSVAPGEKVRTIAYWAAPIGILLAIPWLAEIWKHRKQE
jgi:hypothetical protein